MIDVISMASTGLAFFIVTVSPGPATISNATVAMSHGRKAGLVYGAGLSAGLAFWGIIAATGMGAILQASMYLLVLLKFLGGLYLLWLAFISFKSSLQSDTKATVIRGKTKWFIRGLLLNLSNPKAVVAWMAALSVGIRSTTDGTAIVTATIVCIIVGFLTYGIYSFLFSIKGMMMGYQRYRQKFDGVVAMLFAVAGFGLIRSAIHD